MEKIAIEIGKAYNDRVHVKGVVASPNSRFVRRFCLLIHGSMRLL